MDSSIYGGNVVRSLSSKIEDFFEGRFDLVDDAPYEYYMLKLLAGSQYDVRSLESFTLYILDKEPQTNISVLGLATDLNEGDAVQSEKQPAKIVVSGGTTTILVAGTAKGVSSTTHITYTRSKDIYRVVKPWGHELWINGQHPTYAIKQIFIKDSTKTSVKIHNFKQETNILFSGVARLHFKIDEKKDNLDLAETDIGSVRLEAVSSIDVKPPTLHRLEAIGDILLYEVSTAHLDDVIRVMDETSRPNGRLEKEHGA